MYNYFYVFWSRRDGGKQDGDTTIGNTAPYVKITSIASTPMPSLSHNARPILSAP